MASSCTLLCRRCWCLRLRTDAVTLQYSTRVQRWKASPRTSRKPPVGFCSVSVNNSTRHTGQSWQRQIVFYYSDSLPTPVLTESAGCNDSKEMLRADAVVAREHQLAKMEDTSLMTRKHELLDLDAVVQPSPLDDISDEEAINISVPSTLPPPSSSSLRDYVDKSETLTKLVQLGVKLWKLEQRPNVGSMLLRLDFQMDVSPRLLFLKGIGVEDSRLGYILSHNPFILTEDLENLQARVNYLRSKKFSSESVASMVSRAPYLLNFSVKRLDNRLAFYQQQLGLSAQKTRDVVARLPRLLCGSLEPVKENLKVCKIELGFKENEIQHIVTVVPKVLTANKKKLTQIFDYLHNTMGVPHHLIVKFPQVLNSKFLRIKERHLFLQYLGKAQYDPDQPNYISLGCLVSLPDDAFCSEVALATLEDLCLFQKSM